MIVTTIMTKNALPDKLSALVQHALADLRLCEADPAYAIHMNDWHSPSTFFKNCEVCLAGAVMAKTLESDSREYTVPDNFITGLEYKLYAINALRRGQVDLALSSMGLEKTDKMADMYSLNRPIVGYRNHEETFHTQMHVLVNDLEEAML